MARLRPQQRTGIHTVYAHEIDTGETRAVTDALSDVSEAVFDAGGEYLYLVASTDAGPVVQWFAQSNNDFEMTNALYVAVLAKGTPSPLARKSDEEVRDEVDEEASDDEEIVVNIDFDGLDQRILALPLPEAGSPISKQARRDSSSTSVRT